MDEKQFLEKFFIFLEKDNALEECYYACNCFDDAYIGGYFKIQNYPYKATISFSDIFSKNYVDIKEKFFDKLSKQTKKFVIFNMDLFKRIHIYILAYW